MFIPSVFEFIKFHAKIITNYRIKLKECFKKGIQELNYLWDFKTSNRDYFKSFELSKTVKQLKLIFLNLYMLPL